jgi:hypothetical protein
MNGFSKFFDVVFAASRCRYYFKQSSGTFTADASNYQAGKTCIWVIEGQAPYPISMTVRSLA